MTPPPVLSLDRVSRRFHDLVAVDRVSLDIASGEFFSLLGPSGCGKTTTLRLIAGFDQPAADGGTIRMLGEDVTRDRPYQRPIGMVFQNYALFPHLDVARNVAFGLEERHVPRAEIHERVARALALVRLDHATYASRRPAELSGGQRQRVALARALVLEPPILLLDEPLGALDLQLRKEMQLELRQLNRTLGITFVLVTHDQQEALAMSDRIAVMSAGRVVQVGTPTEIYEHPSTAFVATFIGEANLFAGTVQESNGGMASVIQDDGTRWRVPLAATAAGTPVRIAVRPERHDLMLDAGMARPSLNEVTGVIREIVFLGETLHVLVEVSSDVVVRVALRNAGPTASSSSWCIGQRVRIGWAPEDGQVLQS